MSRKPFESRLMIDRTEFTSLQPLHAIIDSRADLSVGQQGFEVLFAGICGSDERCPGMAWKPWSIDDGERCGPATWMPVNIWRNHW